MKRRETDLDTKYATLMGLRERLYVGEWEEREIL